MKLVALGGADAMRAAAVRKACALGKFDKVVVADYDEAAAVALAAELGSAVRAHRVSATDAAAVRALLDNADLVVNTVGPSGLTRQSQGFGVNLDG